jgi:hypothetical protein
MAKGKRRKEENKYIPDKAAVPKLSLTTHNIIASW